MVTFFSITIITIYNTTTSTTSTSTTTIITHVNDFLELALSLLPVIITNLTTCIDMP